MTALTKDDAVKLYEAGASYVINPHSMAGEHIRHMLSVYGVGSVRIPKIGKNQFNRLIAS